MRRRYEPDPEPASIGLDTVVMELERLGRPRMADFVRGCERMEQRLVAESRRWQTLYEQLRGPVEHAPREKQFDPRPPAEASD